MEGTCFFLYYIKYMEGKIKNKTRTAIKRWAMKNYYVQG